MKIDLQAIQAMARELNRPISSLLALSEDNDPHYCDRPSRMRNAEWFADLYHEHGFGAGVHLRRSHYRLISQREPVVMPSGEPYRNTENCCKILSCASKDARYAGLVDVTDFTDQRNPETFLHLAEIVEEDSNVSAGAAPLFTEPLPALVPEPRLWADAPCPSQPYHIEIWIEKSTINER
jgi:hypothetical protein